MLILTISRSSKSQVHNHFAVKFAGGNNIKFSARLKINHYIIYINLCIFNSAFPTNGMEDDRNSVSLGRTAHILHLNSFEPA